MNAARSIIESLEPRLLLAAHPVASLFVDAPVADEAGLTSGAITVRLDQAAAYAVRVNLEVAGSARAAQQYVPIGRSVVFAPGELSKTIEITPLDDEAALGDKTVVVRLARGGGYSLGRDRYGAVTIVDREPKITVTSAANSIEEEPGGSTVITLHASAPLSATEPVDVYLLATGTARRGRQYDLSEDMKVTFAPGATTATITLSALDDQRASGDRTVVIGVWRDREVFSVANTATVTVTIVDAEPTVTLWSPDAQAAETALGRAANGGSFRITQDGDEPVVVRLAATGTAKAGRDILLSVCGATFDLSTVTVPPGPNGVTIDLSVIDNLTVNGARLASLSLVPDPAYSCAALSSSAVVQIADNDVSTRFALTSAGFRNGATIPDRYDWTSPPLEWSGVPAATKELALIVETPCPVFQPFVQWVVYKIPATSTGMAAGALPPGALQGQNSLGLNSYLGPMPPPGTQHVYYFRLFALNVELNAGRGLTRAQLLSAMAGHVIAEVRLTGVAGEWAFGLLDWLDDLF